MPSDGSLISDALAAMAEPAGEFHSALVLAVEDLRSFLARHRAADGPPEDLAAAELGAFGEGRVDANRFAALIAPPRAIGTAELHNVERALEALVAAEAKGTDLLKETVHRSGDLRETVTRVLCRIGTVFGVVRGVAPLLEGSGEAVDPERLTDGYSFGSWTRAEKAAAPPLFIEVDAPDLKAAGLSEFLEGGQKIVLVVSGTAPPAPLAPLVSPGVMVLQTADPADLESVGRFRGPAVVALAADGLVPFRHDPAAGNSYSERLQVGDMPAPGARPGLGFRENEDLRHLRELATGLRTAAPEAGAVSAAAVDAAPDDDPVGRLAGWLLQQANFTDGAGSG